MALSYDPLDPPALVYLVPVRPLGESLERKGVLTSTLYPYGCRDCAFSSRSVKAGHSEAIPVQHARAQPVLFQTDAEEVTT